MVLDHEQLHTMSNVPISHEYEVISHKKFHERIDKFPHMNIKYSTVKLHERSLRITM